jgi:hypothetical protein
VVITFHAAVDNCLRNRLASGATHPPFLTLNPDLQVDIIWNRQTTVKAITFGHDQFSRWIKGMLNMPIQLS